VTLPAARAQFRELLRRQPIEVGRQPKFLPAETLLCLAAAYVVRPNRYGGANIDKIPSPVPELALLFKRSRNSVLQKMFNLDGTRPNGARTDAQVGAVLRDEQPRLEYVYRVLLKAARAERIGPSDLPDFLGIEDGGSFALLGQEELGPAEFSELLSEIEPSGLPDADTERVAMQTARVGQHFFAKGVLANCEETCVFCGLRPSLFGGRRMLLAGHIKPWRVCSGRERLDVRNGLAACPAHDVAFDTGLLTVSSDLQIHVAPALAAAVASDPVAAQLYGHPPLRETLVLPPGAQPPKGEYLEWHRERVFDHLCANTREDRSAGRTIGGGVVATAHGSEFRPGVEGSAEEDRELRGGLSALRPAPLWRTFTERPSGVFLKQLMMGWNSHSMRCSRASPHVFRSSRASRRSAAGTCGSSSRHCTTTTRDQSSGGMIMATWWLSPIVRSRSRRSASPVWPT
jgi:putative restriction endonuclease